MLEILFLESNNVRKEYIMSSLRACDCNIKLYSFMDEKRELKDILKEKIYHFVFSIDYFSSIALACDEFGAKYVSWVYDHSTLQRNLSHAGVYTNYIFVSEYSLYEKLIKDGFRTIYCFPVTAPDDLGMYEQYIRFMYSILFKEGELEVFDYLRRMEEIREINGNRYWVHMMNKCFVEPENIEDSYVDTIYELQATEREFAFSLKRELTSYIDGMLKKKDKNSDWEIFTWLKKNFISELFGIFWEFYCLTDFVILSLDARRGDTGKGESSLLTYNSMDEMSRVFLQTVFYLRRLEYDLVPEGEREGFAKEFFAYTDKWDLSGKVLKHIVEKAQIFDKQKVNIELSRLRREYRDE